jgi:diguanylate cyclase (GGDEF)-like protein
MDAVVDPTASLGRLERMLLRVSKQHGIKPFIAAVTGISVLLSVAISTLLMVLTGSTTEELVIAIAISVAVPGVVAPAAASMLGRLLLALDEASVELHHLARVDGLTGVLNRRAFAAEAGAVVDLVGDRRLLVAMIDVDDFKGVNDHHGHAAGDLVLVELARRLDEAVGAHGRVGRFGGDEFVAVVAATASDVGAVEARLAVACDLDDVVPGVTASLGTYASVEPVALAEAIARADEALYREKRGRGPTTDEASDDQLAVGSAK